MNDNDKLLLWLIKELAKAQYDLLRFIGLPLRETKPMRDETVIALRRIYKKFEALDQLEKERSEVYYE